MTNFAWWQNEAGKQGLVMCMLCFDMLNIDKMWKDDEGQVWDVCVFCKAIEDAEMERRGLNGSTTK